MRHGRLLPTLGLEVELVPGRQPLDPPGVEPGIEQADLAAFDLPALGFVKVTQQQNIVTLGESSDGMT